MKMDLEISEASGRGTYIEYIHLY
uniref:Uncharacterized protein n=1 Tax=Anguilla anguilla TaxID=7936 RepID=A0A0E9TJ62_ANGAN